MFCPCDKVKKKKNLIAAPGCNDDDAAVAALPDKWKPRHAGPVLINYLKQQEQNHHNVLKDLTDAAVVINKNIDSKIRDIAEALHNFIKQNELDMNCVVDKTASVLPERLSPEERNNALKEISMLHTQRTKDMASFRQEALALEKRRATELGMLLRDQFQRLIKVGHKPPRELLHEFDQKTYEINQQLLSNSRAYAELEAHLQAQTDASLIRLKSDINQLCLGVSKVIHQSSAPYSNRDGNQFSASGSMHGRKSTETSIGQLLGHVQEFDECVNLLVQSYKNAVMKVFSGACGKFSDLRKHLGQHSFIDDISPHSNEVLHLKSIMERVLQKLSDNIRKTQQSVPELIDITRYGTLQMHTSLSSLGDQLRDTYVILHDSGHLWDAHMLRSGLVQKLTMACVEDLITNNDIIELANEVTFNVALAQLRGASDVDKLQQQYEAIVTMLERTAELYKNNFDAEMSKLEEFMKYPETMAKTLMSEFQCFLEKYPRSIISKSGSTASYRGASSPKRDVMAFRSSIPRLVLQTELQEISLQNWRNGFLETFENNVSLVPEELTRHARMWVDEKARSLRMRYSLKLVSHSVRLERVTAARDIRLADLKVHDARLNSHLDAVYALVERLPNEAAEFLALDARELYPFCEWIDDIEAKINELTGEDPVDPERKRLKMLSYAPRLAKHRTLFENSLDTAIEACKRQIENCVQEARISNVRIASQLTVFSDDGRYSAQEAMKASAALMRGADAIEACLNRSMDALNYRRKQILDLADSRLAPLLRIVDEFSKTAKSGDKRKPTPGKKK